MAGAKKLGGNSDDKILFGFDKLNQPINKDKSQEENKKSAGNKQLKKKPTKKIPIKSDKQAKQEDKPRFIKGGKKIK